MTKFLAVAGPLVVLFVMVVAIGVTPALQPWGVLVLIPYSLVTARWLIHVGEDWR